MLYFIQILSGKSFSKMQERSNHYSNKGGHLRRSVINKIMRETNRTDIQLCKSELTFQMRRYTRRITDDGKR
jgi:hypothetical protein